jgi:site-specific DNA-cytosine methylase
MSKYNCLSLFDGISAGQIALQRAGIKIGKYYASEIDKYAIQVTQANWPETIQVGDVTKLDISTLHNIDLLFGGSPCQSLSTSGKQEGFAGKSGLFFEYVRVLKELKALNPKLLFLLENVKMKKEWQEVITAELGVEPIPINSSLQSGQNRQRLYWTNIPNVATPQDKGILLKDILEYGVVDREKSFCIDANYFKGGNITQYFQKSRRQLVFQNEEELKKGRGGDTSAKFRKLTPLECERLQTLPENYTASISATQRYKTIGNSWTVNVITSIFRNIAEVD